MAQRLAIPSAVEKESCPYLRCIIAKYILSYICTRLEPYGFCRIIAFDPKRYLELTGDDLEINLCVSHNI